MPSKIKNLLAVLLVGWGIGIFFMFARSIVWSDDYYSFLNWNLFLAWLPTLVAVILYHLDHDRLHHRVAAPLMLFLWFIFYPNAPYITTDFLHLQENRVAPIQYDFILVSYYSLMGLILGYISIYLVHITLNRHLKNHLLSWVFLSFTFPATAAGVYVGRYLRWNSWYVFTKPIELIRDTFGTITNSLLYTPVMFSYVISLTLVLFAGYLLFYFLVHHPLHQIPQRHQSH